MLIKVDNLIIGAGTARLTAGYSLLKDKNLGTVEIVESSKKIHDIWNINVDAEYHEEKKDSDYSAMKSEREVARSIKN
tara:strand:+ start:281 stop:514 length:234 start_codon:yes stop_codon:yes gene_type:complete